MNKYLLIKELWAESYRFFGKKVLFFLIGVLVCIPNVSADELSNASVETEAVVAPLENAVLETVPPPREIFEQQHQEAVQLARDGNRKEALAILVKLHEQDPADITITFDYILVLTWDEQWQQAVEQFEKLSAQEERPAYLLKAVATAYGILGKKDQELALYAQILEQEPDDIVTLEKMFWPAFSLERYDEADRINNQLLTLSPKNTAYIFQRAELLWITEGPVSSITWLDKNQKILEGQSVQDFLQKMIPSLSEEQWKDIGVWFNTLTLDSLPVPHAVIGLACLNRSTSAKMDFSPHLNAFMNNFDQYSESVQFEIAVWVEHLGLMEEAKGLYRKIFNRYSSYRSVERLAHILMREGAHSEAMAFVDQGLALEPNDYGLLILKGELFEQQKDFVGALACYNRILEIFPDNEAAYNLKMRVLMDLGGNSLAVDHMEKGGQAVDPVLLERGKGNLAMNYVRWDEPKDALTLTSRTLEISALQENIDPKAAGVEIDRTYWDRIVALGENQQFGQVLSEYEKAVSENLAIPLWVHAAAADAYLYQREPEKALEIYEDMHARQPKSFKVDMALYYTLVDLGRYQEATDLLNAIDSELPAQIIERGILSENWQKAEVAYNKVWLLMYQDRLAEAEKLAQEYLQSSPANMQLRTVLAHIYLWRGWPRKALKEFQMVQNMDYENIPSTNGYVRSLYENVKKQEARDTIDIAYEQYPNNRHVQRTRRLIEVYDKPYVTFSGYYYTEDPGSDEWLLSLRGDQPVTDYHQLFAEMIWRRTKYSGSSETTERAYIGDIWRPNNIWKLTGAFSLDPTSGGDTGWLSEVELTPDDFWTFGLGYDSYSLGVPLRSRAGDVTAKDTDAFVRFRLSEAFQTQLSAGFKVFSDGNENYNYRWTTDTAVTTSAYWKTRIQTEFGYSTFSRQNVNYFSPEDLYEFYVIPMVEHVWWRRYEKAWVDRFYLGLGQQWQKGYGSEDVGYIRYELDHRYSDTLNALVGVTYALKNYDGGNVDGLTIYWMLRKHF